MTKDGIMKILLSIIRNLISALAIIIILYGGLLVAKSCSYISTSGGLGVDLSPIFSFFGLCLLIVGMVILVKRLREYQNVLNICVFTYGILLMVACIFVNYYTKNRIYKLYESSEMPAIQPNGFSAFIAVIIVFGLIIYPFIKKL